MDEHLIRTMDAWDELAKEDPLWAVLSLPEDGERKKWELDSFFETGERDVAQWMEVIKDRKLAVDRMSALDFGCGMGRLTRALSKRFKNATGVDASPEMARRAQELTPECRFVANKSDNLQIFGNNTFDCIISAITLQHIPPTSSIKYIEEMYRILKPDGALMFQIPSAETKPPEQRLYKMETHFIPSEVIFKKIEDMGAWCFRHERVITDHTRFIWDTFWLTKRP